MSMSFFYGLESPVSYDSPESAPAPETEVEMQNKATVRALYKAVAGGEAVAGLVAGDLEWWFHGPAGCQHMMRLLTGGGEPGFRFEPRSVAAIGDSSVVAEGWEGRAYWVHVWTLSDNVVTHFREYFNTWLTVTELRQSMTLWQSQPRDLAKRSLPGLVIAM